MTAKSAYAMLAAELDMTYNMQAERLVESKKTARQFFSEPNEALILAKISWLNAQLAELEAEGIYE